MILFTTTPPTINQRLELLYLLLALIFLTLALIGGIGWLFETLIKKYGDQVDAETWKIYETRTVNTPKEFARVAFKKSHRQAFKDFLWALLTIGSVAGLLFGYMAIFNDPTLIDDLFNYQTRGFNTIFPIFDWSNIPTNEFFGFYIISDWPILLNVPRFVPEATMSYVLFLLSLLGGLLTFRATLALIGRTMRIQTKKNQIFMKNLDEVAKKL
jgi:TRAP-type C4-dicarboxylate transport system permease small subunit